MSLRAEVGLVLLLVLGVTLALLAGRRAGAPAAEFEPASTLSYGPTGGSAPYDVLAELGRRVERRRLPLFDLSTNVRHRPGLLMVVDPELELADGELAQVTHFLQNGGALIAVGMGGGITTCAGWALSRVRRDSLPVDSALGQILPRTSVYLTHPPTAAPPVSRRNRQIREVEDSRCETLVALGADTLVRTRSGRPVVLRLRYQNGGRLILAADDGWFRNRAWRTTSLPQAIVPFMLSLADTGSVVWDEYHHGHASGSADAVALGWLVGTPGGLATLQLAVVVLIWLGVSAVRFGPARPVIERRRRSPLEHVDALAAGLESAGGSETALMLVVAGLRRRLSRTGRAPRGDSRQWLATLALAMHTPRGRQAATQLTRLLTQPGGGERVLAAANSVEDVWEELRPRTTHDAS
jgi:hypothetical protein